MELENMMEAEVPTLSFDVVEEPAVPVVVEKEVPQESDVLAQAQLSEAEKQMVKDFVLYYKDKLIEMWNTQTFEILEPLE